MADKPTIKISFTDFWPDLNTTDSFFYKLLLKKYNVTISDKPDILFYSTYGNNHSKFSCTKVFYTAENIRPDFNDCDYSFSFDYPFNEKNYRLPLYALYDDVSKLIRSKSTSVIDKKKKFCCFVVSNPNGLIRNKFFASLSKYKHIDSGGSVFNNIGQRVANKREFIKDYKFVIAFENSSYPGYATEKIFEPLLENCVPIYWGNPLIDKDFNTESFINCHDFASFDEAIQRIVEVDQNDKLYLEYLNAPAFAENKINSFVREDNILKRLDEIVRYSTSRTISLKLYHYIRPVYCTSKAAIIRIKVKLIRLKKQWL